ncbi:Protein-S-isoprenylcysteine O-methyltransferase [Mycena venus]|uniref:Protein-S-isoprenylcysteine O-methyltransferase n=1 Tax=Mycena venus TaxID=2733690 RepID=A0A8H6XEW8_9AGAR|nr:Protein-S-isoprenylcysteine O-methyltransferase [Mycena venus]
MSLLRVALVVIQTVFNELASTPPNPTPEKCRYHKDQLYIFQIAPLILRIHQITLRLCAALEVLFYLTSLPEFSILSPYTTLFSFAAHPVLRPTPLFIIGVVAVILGALIRLSCFRALGELFTFELTILPQHRLVTSGLYAYVRHPAYTGSLTIIAGLAFSHLSPGSWLWEAGPLHLAPWSGPLVGAVWWLWTLGIGLSRVEAEDKQMSAMFPDEWDAYAVRVPCWFIPGVI